MDFETILNNIGFVLNQQILKGNTDTYTVSENWLELPIVGVNAIRLVPYSQHYRMVCLRFELYGCSYKGAEHKLCLITKNLLKVLFQIIQFKNDFLNLFFCFHFSDGPIRYSMPDGQFGGRYGDLIDDTYDGVRLKNEYLTGGLGQLTDGVFGADSLKLNGGYEWIGWKATQNSSLQLQFEFEQPRNFSLVRIHCHNQFRRSIECAQQVHVQFSWDGKRWSKGWLQIQLPADHQNEQPRELQLPLQHRVGRHVRLQLRFSAKWMLISEVRFSSTLLHKNYQLNFNDMEPQMPASVPVSVSTSTGTGDGGRLFDSSLLTDSFDLLTKLQGKQMLQIDSRPDLNQVVNQDDLEVHQLQPALFAWMTSWNRGGGWIIGIIALICMAVLIVWQRLRTKSVVDRSLTSAGLLTTGLLQHGEKLQLMHKLNAELGAALQPNKQPYSTLPPPLVSSASAHEYAVPNLNQPNLAHYEEIAGQQRSPAPPMPPPLPPTQHMQEMHQTQQTLSNGQLNSNIFNGSHSPLVLNGSNEYINSNCSSKSNHFTSRDYNSGGSSGSTGRSQTSTCSTFRSAVSDKRSNTLQSANSSTINGLLCLLRDDLHLPQLSGIALKFLQPFAGTAEGQLVGIGRLSSKHCPNSATLSGSFGNSKRLALVHQPQGDEQTLLKLWNAHPARWIRFITQLQRSNVNTDNFAHAIGFIAPQPSCPLRLISEFGDCSLVAFLRQKTIG